MHSLTYMFNAPDPGRPRNSGTKLGVEASIAKARGRLKSPFTLPCCGPCWSLSGWCLGVYMYQGLGLGRSGALWELSFSSKQDPNPSQGWTLECVCVLPIIHPNFPKL